MLTWFTVHADDEPHSPRVWGPAVWGPTTVARHSYDSHGQPSPRRPEGEHECTLRGHLAAISGGNCFQHEHPCCAAHDVAACI
jgi:hypothetical protein